MRILIVGGNGFVGRELVKFFSAQGIEVLNWSSSGSDPAIGSDGALRTNFPKGIARVIFLSQSPHYRQEPFSNPHLFRVNAQLPVEIALRAAEAGVEHFTYFSTGSVYKPSILTLNEDSPLERVNPYSLSKLHGEEGLGLVGRGMSLLIVRPFFVYGDGQKAMLIPKLVERVKTNQAITIEKMADEAPAESSGLVFTPIHVGQLVECIDSLVLNRVSGIFNLAGEEPISIKTLGLLIGSEVGREPAFEISSRVRAGNYVADVKELKNVIGRRDLLLNSSLRDVVRSYV